MKTFRDWIGEAVSFEDTEEMDALFSKGTVQKPSSVMFAFAVDKLQTLPQFPFKPKSFKSTGVSPNIRGASEKYADPKDFLEEFNDWKENYSQMLASSGKEITPDVEKNIQIVENYANMMDREKKMLGIK